MVMTPNTDLAMRNAMEDMVFRTIDALAKSPERLPEHERYCFCKRCRLDVAAFALNHLPPKYVVNEMGNLWTRAHSMSIQNEVNLLNMVIQALEVVRANPKH